MPDRTPSPPTRRVVAVVEMLSGLDRSVTVSEISSTLGISRATATAILAELADTGWAQRDVGLRYRLGPAVRALANDRPVSSTQAILAELAAHAACGVTLCSIGRTTLTIEDKCLGGSRRNPGVPVGQQIPLRYPAGATVMPRRSEADLGTWLDTASDDERSGSDELLSSVSALGVAVFRPQHDDDGLVDVLASLLDVMGPELRDNALRSRALTQLAALTSRPYTHAEVTGTATLPISYIAAPVFGTNGALDLEIQMVPLRASVTAAQRASYIDLLRTAAASMSQM